MDNRKNADILFENDNYDPYTFRVWVDSGNINKIAAVPGVVSVWNDSGATDYVVKIDHRYDRNHVQMNIYAAIMV